MIHGDVLGCCANTHGIHSFLFQLLLESMGQCVDTWPCHYYCYRISMDCYCSHCLCCPSNNSFDFCFCLLFVIHFHCLLSCNINTCDGNSPSPSMIGTFPKQVVR
eukprot:288600_1